VSTPFFGGAQIAMDPTTRMASKRRIALAGRIGRGQIDSAPTPFKLASLRAGGVTEDAVMDDRPGGRESSTLDAAFQRRARLIADMHEQANAVANADRLAQRAAAAIAHSRWRKADGIIATAALKIIAVAAFIALLGCILALWGR
jgi:hypothetical protein